MNASDPKTREIMDKRSYESSFHRAKNYITRHKSII